MATESKFTGMVVVSGGAEDGERGPFQNDVMTILEMESLLWSGEEYTVRMQRTDEVED
jgi:hypothetical protein